MANDYDMVHIVFSTTDSVAGVLVGEAEALAAARQRMQNTLGYLLGAGFQAAFRAEIEMKWQLLRESLTHFIEEANEEGRDLHTAVELFRQLDMECQALSMPLATTCRGKTGRRERSCSCMFPHSSHDTSSQILSGSSPDLMHQS